MVNIFFKAQLAKKIFQVSKLVAHFKMLYYIYNN